MNFFSFDPTGDNGFPSFTVSHHFWVYWALSVPMTVATLVVWFWWTRWAKNLTMLKSKAGVLPDA